MIDDEKDMKCTIPKLLQQMHIHQIKIIKTVDIVAIENNDKSSRTKNKL